VVTLATLPELENSEPIDNDMSDPIPKKVSRMGERQTSQEGLGKSQTGNRSPGRLLKFIIFLKVNDHLYKIGINFAYGCHPL
jgi:hypothetical protein